MRQASMLIVLMVLAACGQRVPGEQSAGRIGHLADTDGDGVTDDLDRCPGTTVGPVNDFGCRDLDEDGVPDEEDQCPGTAPGIAVGSNGCPYVGSSERPVGSEVHRPRIIGLADFEARWWGQFARPAPLACPGDSHAPSAPEVTNPAIWSVELATQWTAQASLNVTWTSVTDDCGPLTYGIEVQSRNMSTGRWQAELSLGDTHLSSTAHQLSWLTNTWGRFRVWATDANGQSSLPTSWRYFIWLLSQICG